MILYFADRHLNILGSASTYLPDGIRIIEDLKTEDVDTGVSIFECDLFFDRKTRLKLEEWAEVGNFILRSSGDENEFYNIIDAEIDTKKQKIRIYAEDDGLDLLNEVAEAFTSDQYHPISFYVNKYASGSGWEIGINEVEGLTRKLSWDSEQTASARLLSIAEAFNNCELSYSFEIKGLQISKKYINIYEKRGKDTGIQLRLNKEIDSIVTTKTISNLATALRATGGTPDNAENPITLLGYEYDDGDFYVDGAVLKSRKALEKWSRYLWKDDETQQTAGHIVKSFSYDTTSQAVLCEKTIAELKQVCDMEVNYEADISKFPDNVKIGDRVNIIDDAGNLYLSSRILILETSAVDKTRTAVIGEHLIRKNGISSKVEQLAAEFAKQTVSVARAKAIADEAKASAIEAIEQVDEAIKSVEEAHRVVSEVVEVVDTAKQSAAAAQEAANNAQQVVDSVETRISSLETTVTNAQNAANNAHQAAETATQKAEEAKTAAENATADVEEAKTAASNAQTASQNAISKAETAENTANTAKTTAESASATAQAAKLDAEQAEKDVEAFGENLETYKQTVLETYTRKTELTETTASLQAQITANANQLTITHSKVVEVDETANNAAELAEQAQSEAQAAQQQANQATADAEASQQAANEAKAAAQAAQAEADTAKTAAETAQSVADKAEADLEAAKADLATVQGRVDATEEEIANAQAAVETAQAAADKAKTDAAEAATAASNAQTTANTAVSNAQAAQNKANEAANKADLAQQAADTANGNAQAAQQTANEAAQAAATAQETANTAVSNAATAQAKANEAASEALAAQNAADEAANKANAAQNDLNTAKQNLENVTSRVGATEEEVAAAQQAVIDAQAAADEADRLAKAAQSTADTAKANAATAQTAANNAKTAADNAQAAAEAAQEAADKAQADANALAVRVTTAESNIKKNADAITATVTKTELAGTLGGYYTKEQTDSQIEQTAKGITSTVSKVQTDLSKVATDLNNLEFGGRNLLKNSFRTYDCNKNSEHGTNVVGFEVVDGYDLQTLIGETLTFSYFVHCPGARNADENNSLGERFGMHGIIDWVDANGNKTTQYPFATYLTTSHTNERVSMSTIVTAPEGYSTISVIKISFQPHAIPAEGNSELWRIGLPKLEVGNKATDWTPAPEDVADDIKTAKDTADTANSAVKEAESEIQQLAESISMLVTDGNGTSLMTQTADGWTFSTADIQKSINDASNSLNDITESLGSTDKAVDVLKQAVADIGAKTDYVNISTYTYTNDEGEEVTEPCIELGEAENDYKVLITNTQILFKIGSAAPTRINADGLVTDNITIENELRQTNDEVNGFFVWAVRSNGNYGLQWKGAET